MAMNLGKSIVSDAAGIVGNITKATLMFPDSVSAINLIEKPDDALAFGKKLGMSDDEIQNRANWTGTAYDVDNIIEILKGLC